MRSFSMISCLVVFLSSSNGKCDDVIVNMRYCLKTPPESVTDTCPANNGNSCPMGACEPAGVGGCISQLLGAVFFSSTYSTGESINSYAESSDGNGIMAVREPNAGLLCYKRWPCECDLDAAGGSVCKQLDYEQRLMLGQWFVGPANCTTF